MKTIYLVLISLILALSISSIFYYANLNPECSTFGCDIHKYPLLPILNILNLGNICFWVIFVPSYIKWGDGKLGEKK